MTADHRLVFVTVGERDYRVTYGAGADSNAVAYIEVDRRPNGGNGWSIIWANWRDKPFGPVARKVAAAARTKLEAGI